MKQLNIFLLLFFGILLNGCMKNHLAVNEETGDFKANFDFPTYPINAPAKVALTNRTKYGDKFLWEFDDARVLARNGDTLNASSSEKLVPDTLLYALPGTYTVKLTAWQGSTKQEISKSITIGKARPVINVPENIGVVMDVVFSASVFKFPNKPVTYNWDFGEAGTSTEATPTVQFVTEGTHTVKLTVNDGEEVMTTEITIFVQGELARTLYFTDAFTRKLYMYKLKTLTASEVQWIGATTGYNPFGLSVKGNKLYLSETGFGISFAGAPANIADGYIKSFNLDGTGESIVVKPGASNDYRDDPWMHTVDQYGTLWWTTRNYGARFTNATSVEFGPQGAQLGKLYVNADRAGEATTTYFASDIKEVKNELWMSYAGATGKGIFKFKHDGTYIGKFATDIQKYSIRTFVVDSISNHIYFAINRNDGLAPGVYRANIDGSNIVPIDNGTQMGIGAGGFSNQGVNNEYAYITSMAIDVNENGDGYLYYPYRANTDVYNNTNPVTLGPNANNSGIKRYKLDGSAAPEFFIQGYAPYGIALDPVKR